MNTVKKGYLTKEGGRYKNWKRRWFVLQESSEAGGCLTLSYYTNEQEKDILGVIDLKQCRGVRHLQHEKEGRKHVLHVICKHRDFFLSADSGQQQQDWFDIINGVLKMHHVASETLPELKMGYLVKLGGSRKNWRKRWFVLENSLLTYYKKEGEKKALGRFTLRDCLGIQLADEDKIKRPFGFEILTPDRTYVVCAPTETERDDWMEALEDCIPEAGEEPGTPGEQTFDQDEEGQSDEEDEGFVDFALQTFKATARASRRRKGLSIVIDMPISKQGFLIKQGGVYKNFKKRWFLLVGTSLCYYKDQGDKKPLGIIALEYCSGLRLVEDEKAKRPYCFEINIPDRIFLIQAYGEEDRAEWMQAIEDAIPEILEEDTPLVELVVERKDSRREERRQEIIAKFSTDQGSDNEDSEEEADDPESPPPAFRTKTGWLTKEGGQYKSRKKRWFVLDGFFLHYFKSEKDQVPAGSIDLKSSKSVTILPPGGANCWAFELITLERVYYIEADSEKLRKEWLEVIEATIALVRPKTSQSSGAPSKSGYLEKRGAGNKSWKKRFFVLEGSRIKYYNDEKSQKVLNVIDLGLCRGLRRTPPAKGSKPFCFDLFTPHRIYSFAADAQAAVDSWLSILADAVPDDPAPKTQRKAPTTAEDLNAARLGYLYKLDNTTSSWRRRWFVLKNESQLFCYRDEEDVFPLMTIDMGKCMSIQEAPAKLFDRRNCFTVNLVGGVVHALAGVNADDTEDWIDVLGDSVPEDISLPIFHQEAEEEPVIQGFLTKQGGHRKTWKRRWFVFKGHVITYYKKKNDSEPLGFIHVRSLTDIGSSIKDELPLETPNGFAILTPERTFYIGADSPEERSKWVEAMKAYIRSKAQPD